ncbi:hypothetical protein B0H10DRAFT_2063203 [Mycena sp. CBHHK59/15]|nr:hypothetical protein B0H10DRAFT_2063203 [Mycena sp. CBHHK59/15]
MDIDCDGVDENSDGYPLTSFGALDAREVPWFVLPETIICNGTMFYAIFGDTKPNLLSNDAIDGNNGHEGRDILFSAG